MIDKSIRQYYQEGKKVNVIQEGIDKFTGNVKEKLFPQDDTGLDEKQLIKNVAGSFLQNKLTTAAASKLAGTGILSSLGPIGMIIAAMLANKGIKYAKGKIKPDIRTALQSFQEGMIGSPEEQRELRQLENRRQDMLQRKDEGRNYSEKNLDMVTRAIAEAKGLDINNPNEMRNIDKPITQIKIEKSITPISKIDPQDEPSFTGEGYDDTIKDILDKKTAPLRTTPIIDYEGEAYGTPDTIANIRAQEKAEAEIAMQKTIREAEQQQREKAEFDRVVAENKAKAEAEAAAQRAYAARVPDPIYQPQGGGGGGRGGQTSQAAADRAGGSSYSSPFKYGGPVYVYKRNNSIDKALKGRKRDI